MRRTLLVIFCLGLLGTVGVVFTRSIAARVPEQRATLEKLITDRTGLAVRFDNVHFAWGIDGTSAVFERVELTDPEHGRVRVVAPELRVEFNTWDFLRHQQFSLGHVTLTSPDIDIIGEPETAVALARSAPVRARAGAQDSDLDEAALVRRYTAWAELMPVGRIEVESARVHLFRRGEHTARHNFTLSQAVVSRGNHSFNAFGTLLLSQDVGQSLFVSAKLDKIGAAGSGVSGELRLIARRVFLDKLSALQVPGAELAARGRGTVDARLTLRDGRLHDGHWQMSARELELPRGPHFDHFTVQGTLSRARDDVLLEFRDLQVTRGARLERAPKLAVRLGLQPGTLRVARTMVAADRVPFMAAEFLAGVLAIRLDEPLAGFSTDWTATAGELRSLRFDSRAGTFSAQLHAAEISRGADHARIQNLFAKLELEAGQARLSFDAGQVAQLHLRGAGPRDLALAGAVTIRAASQAPTLDFAALQLQSGDGILRADGRWHAATNSRPLTVELAQVDRALLGDAWTLLGLQEVAQLADLQAGRIVSGSLNLTSGEDAQGKRIVDWRRSRGSLQLADLASAGADVPRLVSAAGSLEFSRGGAQLRLTSGQIEDLLLTDARIDWPRRGPPRLRASAQGDLRSPLLRAALREQGLERLTGEVALDAEARGDAELRDPAAWRVTARLSNGSLPLKDLPAVEKLAGTVRLSGGRLRGLALEGSWLGGPVAIESRRAGEQGVTSANISGAADAAPLLRLLGQSDAAGQVNGQLAWSGTVQRRMEDSAERAWQVSLSSNLAGLESRLPEPFAKPRTRQLQVSAELRFDAQGVREFEIESGRDAIRGRVQDGVTTARFALRGVEGELRASDASADPRVTLDKLELRRAPAVLAAVGALLPADGALVLNVTGLRHANRDLGGLQASLARRAADLQFSLQSTDSPHELDATGVCLAAGRCQMEFSIDTRQLPALLAGAELPAEWPTQALHASGQLAWSGNAGADFTRTLTGNFELETLGADSGHQLMASALLADGQIELANVQGAGPDPDQVFRGSGRVGLLARTYDLAVDYEQVSLAASAVPTPARARVARAWTSLRGSVARRGWTESTPTRRVQWHGSWDGDTAPLLD